MSLPIGVCSWSLQVRSVPELQAFVDRLGIDLVQIACGDPHHASWNEGDDMPAAARQARFRMGGAMLGFPGEDYTTPQHIQKTGGFGDPATRAERLEILKWGVRRTRELGLADLSLHAGYLPALGDPARPAFLETLGRASALAAEAGVTLAFETGQESSALLRATLDDLKCPNLKVNFDPANMLLYDEDDPIAALELLAPDIRSVHLKDANRPPRKGVWGEEVPLGRGQVDFPKFLKTLSKIGYAGPLFIEREVGNQAERFADIEMGIALIRELESRR